MSVEEEYRKAGYLVPKSILDAQCYQFNYHDMINFAKYCSKNINFLVELVPDLNWMEENNPFDKNNDMHDGWSFGCFDTRIEILKRIGKNI